jgi:hypothetical protein
MLGKGISVGRESCAMTLVAVGIGGRRRDSEVVTDMEDRNQTERNKAVIRRFVEEVQNGKDFDAYDELNDPDFVNLSSPRASRRIGQAASCFFRRSPRLTPTQRSPSTP